jgi:hypothetical protein
MKITETDSNLPTIKPVKEIMGIDIPNVNTSIPHRNGFVAALIGAPGTGKSSLLLSMFGKGSGNNYYRNKFDNIYLITPESSFLSVSKHPFEGHEKLYHELTDDVLDDIYNEIIELKLEAIDNDEPIEHSLIIIDDYASDLKDKDIINVLKKILIKSRHINTSFIFTLQAYNLFPLVLRKLLWNAIVFKPNNRMEMESVSKELLMMKSDDALQIYNYVFNEPYNHLDIDLKTNKLQKNFNELKIE